MVGKIFRGLLLLLVLALTGAALVLVRFDLPHGDMVAKYGQGASQFIDLPDGARAHYRDEGYEGGPTLVLIHGSTASLHTWEPWVKELGDTFRIVSVDLPGHGLTGAIPSSDYSRDAMVEFVRDLMSELQIERFSIAGNSMGGGVALALALDYPLRVEKLVLVSSAGLSRLGESDPPAAFRLAGTPIVRDLMAYVTPRFLIADAVRKVIVDQNLVSDEMIDRYHELLLHEGNREATMARFAASANRTPLDDRLAELEMPALILWGDKDPLIPVSHAPRFEAGIADARAIVYENTGHIAMEEVPARSAADVRAFLRE